jgi:putative aldouronate transport system permease protein
MMVPVVVILAIYQYYQMVGLAMAFQDFIPNRGFFGSPWIGFDHFEYIFSLNDFKRTLFNTIFIAMMKILAGITCPLILALMLNEVGRSWYKRTVQTITYLPNFLSWVVLGGILKEFLSPVNGAFNMFLKNTFGIDPIYWLGKANIFPYMIVLTDLWKEVGFGTIIFLAALTAIDPSLYEAAIVDGASRWKQMWHVSLPGLAGIFFLVCILSLGSVLQAGFNQIFVLYSPLVYSTGDVLETLTYRIGLEQARFSIATAMGLFQSVVSLIMVSTSYLLANKYSNYRIF